MAWRNHMEIKSETSSRLYTVSELVRSGIPTGTYGYSCPGWKRFGECKHLTTMGLPSARERKAVTTGPQTYKQRVQNAHSFSDAAYDHYDTRNGFGSADEWIRIAEERARGRGRYRRPTAAPGIDWYDLKLLDLTAMPEDAKGLVRAMRKRAMVLHPDHGGDAEQFKAMFAAYERLIKYYPKGA